MFSFQIKSTLRFLAVSFLLLQFAKVYAQCGTCTTTISSNSPSSYTVSAGQTVCVATGFDFTGTITLNGGTLCNGGTVHNINFNSGVFNNNGNYTKATGTVTITNNNLLEIYNKGTISLYNLFIGGSNDVLIENSASFIINRAFDIQKSNDDSKVTILSKRAQAFFGSYQSNFHVIKDMTVTKGKLDLIIASGAILEECIFTQCGALINIGGQVLISNSEFSADIGARGVFNIAKSLSLDNRKNKTITNGGVLNINGDLNVGGNGQNVTTVAINNNNLGLIEITKNVNFAFNNGIVEFNNNATRGGVFVGRSLSVSKDGNSVINNGQFYVSNNLNVERGSFVNKLSSGLSSFNEGQYLEAKNIEVKFGTLTNNAEIFVSRDLFTSNSAGIINNNKTIDVGRNFINTSTVNLGKKSTITTLNYENEGNSVINGPTNINDENGDPDSTNYASVIISGNSKNSGYINNYVLVYDKTRPTNSTIGFDDFGNANRVAPEGIIIAPANPLTRCLLTIFYNLSAVPSPNQVCSGDQVSLTASTSYLLTSVQPNSISYSWNTSPITNAATAIVSPTNSTSYTVTATYVFPGRTCIKTKSVNVTVNPIPTITITGNTTICSGQTTTLTASGASTYVWSSGFSGLNFTTPALTSSTTYTVTGTNTATSCTATATTTLTVTPTPTIVATSTTVCNGQSATITASGANSFIWNTGASTASLTINPALSTTTYTVTGTISSCTATATATITVNTVSVNAGIDQTINAGSSANLSSSVSGGTSPYSYIWTPGGTNSFDAIVNPTQTTTYSLAVTDANGCIGSDEVIITLINVPVASYAHLKKTLDGSFYQVVTSDLKFIFNEEYKDGNLTFSVLDTKRSVILSNTNQIKKYGDNRYAIDVSSLVVGSFYTLEVKSDKNEVFLLKFKYR